MCLRKTIIIATNQAAIKQRNTAKQTFKTVILEAASKIVLQIEAAIHTHSHVTHINIEACHLEMLQHTHGANLIIKTAK